jgi:hypothetical protein
MTAANKNNVRFNLNNDNNVEDIVRHNNGLQVGGNGNNRCEDLSLFLSLWYLSLPLISLSLSLSLPLISLSLSLSLYL